MASINFFSRIGNLLSGFISLFIEDVEKKHPEIAYQNAIQSMVDKYTRLKQATAAIIRRREDIEARLKSAQAAFAQANADLEAALDTDQDDLALSLLEQKGGLESSIAELTVELEQAQKDADEAKSSLLEVKAEIGKLKAEKDRMLAKMQSAQARIRIQEQLEGLSVDADVQALNTVRDHIKNTVAQASLGQELRESDLDVRMAKLRQTSGKAAARAELDKLKAQRATAATASKTL
jgi:phage shock protein A